MEVGHTRNRLARTAGLMVAGLTVLACALSPASSPTPSAPPTQSPAISPTASPSATATPTPSPTVTATPAPEAAISAGLVHSCALVDGRVLCWGSNQMGEVGQGPTIGAVWYGPVEVAGLWGVTAISAGGSAHPFDSRPGGGHSCALAGGRAWCWGGNYYGQLGDGTDVDVDSCLSAAPPATCSRSIPVEVKDLSGVTAISTGGDDTCAVAGGRAWCWGDNQYGQLGNGTTEDSSTPVEVQGLSGVIAISTGGNDTCAVTGGRVLCWGQMLGWTPVEVAGLSGVTAISVGFVHACAIADGRVLCWGNNEAGQLGDGTTVSRATPVEVQSLSGATALDAGLGHTCAVAGGRAWCWGSNWSGQLGNGTTNDSSTPVEVAGLSGLTAISAGGWDHTCAMAGGRAWCWGSDWGGKLGASCEAPLPTDPDLVFDVPCSTPVEVQGLHITPSSSPSSSPPLVTPTTIPTLSPAPGTPFELPGYDSNVVYFGREVDEDTATIPNPVTDFGLHQQIFWAFYTSLPFEVRTISLEVVRVEGSDYDDTTVVISQDFEVVPIEHQLYSHLGRDAIQQPGDYIMRFYISDDAVIAEGWFTIT